MSEAKDWREPTKGTGGNVYLLPMPRREVAALTDAEVAQVRKMIRQFGAIMVSCPIARRATGGDG